MITNRVIGGSFIFGDREKKHFLSLLVGGQERHGYRLLDYVLMDNHYHCLLEIPPPDEMSRKDLVERWNMTSHSNGHEPDDDILEAYRQKIHDISFVVGNFEQRFVQWYNLRKERLGSLFNRFDSVIVGEGEPLADVMAYITLNPVRAGIVSDPADYHWCAYANRVANGRLNEFDVELVDYLHRAINIPPQITQLPEKRQLELLWKYFRIRLLRTGIKAHANKGKWKPSNHTVGGQLERQNKAVDLDKARCFMLKVRFATKGIAIGSEEFVEHILSTCGKVLGYKREHHSHDYHAWDHIHTLKKHRKVYC